MIIEALAKTDHSVVIFSFSLGYETTCYVLDLAEHTSTLGSVFSAFSLDASTYVRAVGQVQVHSLSRQSFVSQLVFKYLLAVFKCHKIISWFIRLFCNNGTLL